MAHLMSCDKSQYKCRHRPHGLFSFCKRGKTLPDPFSCAVSFPRMPEFLTQAHSQRVTYGTCVGWTPKQQIPYNALYEAKTCGLYSLWFLLSLCSAVVKILFKMSESTEDTSLHTSDKKRKLSQNSRCWRN